MKIVERHVNERLAIAITSIARIGRKIYLGLTSGENVLAVYDIDQDRITLEPPLFPWAENRGYCTKIHNGMGSLEDGSLLIGEGNHFTWDGLPVTVNYFNRELPERMLARKWTQGWPDVTYTDFCRNDLVGWNRVQSDPGGIIMRYHPDTGAIDTIGRLPSLHYVQSLIVDAPNNKAFGHTLPDNHFFMVDLADRSIHDFGRISDFAHHNMVVTPEGICYGGWVDLADRSLRLLKFDPNKKHLEYLSTIILNDIGSKIAGNQGIDSWIVTRSGEIYMGTVDEAQFFRFDPNQERFESLQSIGLGGRVTCMSEDENGIVWIGAGYPRMHLIRFDPRLSGSAAFTDYGPVNTTYERCYFHGACCFEGKLYLAETDGFSPSLHIVDLTSL